MTYHVERLQQRHLVEELGREQIVRAVGGGDALREALQLPLATLRVEAAQAPRALLALQKLDALDVARALLQRVPTPPDRCGSRYRVL